MSDAKKLLSIYTEHYEKRMIAAHESKKPFAELPTGRLIKVYETMPKIVKVIKTFYSFNPYYQEYDILVKCYDKYTGSILCVQYHDVQGVVNE